MGDPNDPDDPSFVVYYPGMCRYLTEYSYWWYFWDCANRPSEGERTADAPACDPNETVTLTPQNGGVLVTITRSDGRVTQRLTFPNRKAGSK